jgi:pectinesterase
MKTNMKALVLLIIALTIVSNSILSQDVYEMTVALDGSGNYTSVQKAIDACKSFPDKRITIHIKNGVYNEKIVVPSCNNRLSIIGESVEKTIITYGDYFGKVNRGRNSTFYTYTILVEADDFYAENLTIENSAGAVGQALALSLRGDRCAFHNCRIMGNQDTLYTDGLNSRQYFKDCYIEGTTDFIFGSATVLFKDCIIFSKINSFITAASTPQGLRFGYVFLNCKVQSKAGVDKVYLGRPWRDYAKVVFLNCDLGAHIVPAGWSNWAGTSRDKTAYFAEFENTGPGAGNSLRVNWSHQLTKNEASDYTLEKILAPVIPVQNTVLQWTEGKN